MQVMQSPHSCKWLPSGCCIHEFFCSSNEIALLFLLWCDWAVNYRCCQALRKVKELKNKQMLKGITRYTFQAEMRRRGTANEKCPSLLHVCLFASSYHCFWTEFMDASHVSQQTWCINQLLPPTDHKLTLLQAPPSVLLPRRNTGYSSLTQHV